MRWTLKGAFDYITKKGGGGGGVAQLRQLSPRLAITYL